MFIFGLSDEAWALLGILRRAESGGPYPLLGFEQAYCELQAGHLAATDTSGRKRITPEGAEALKRGQPKPCG
jgi:hypothetical protein